MSNKTLNEVDIFAPQDPSVGMFSVSLTIDLQGLEVEEAEDVEFIRQQLANCFSEIYDDSVRVTFDFERERDVLWYGLAGKTSSSKPPPNWQDLIEQDDEYQANQPLTADDYFGAMHP